MKQKIKDFLLRKRFFKRGVKVLKNKKGFSLLEVLIAVGIIGIIGAIAYPSFEEYRNNAARVASDTSATNVVKAFRNCIILNGFSQCDTRAKLKINCPGGSTCSEGKDVTNGKMCVGISRGSAGNDFKVCVSVGSDGSESRTYGGSLLTSTVCHRTGTNLPSKTCAASDRSEKPYNINTACTSTTDCTAPADTTNCTFTVSACKIPTTNGTCQSNGICL